MTWKRLGHARYLVVGGAILALGLVSSAGAAPPERSATSIVTRYFGPVITGPGQTIRLHAVNHESVTRVARLEIRDEAGGLLVSDTVSLAPRASVYLPWSFDEADYRHGIIRSGSTGVTGSLELVAETTGAPTGLMGPSSLLGGSSGPGACGPVTVSDELTEQVAFTNVVNASRMVTTTFYDETGTVLDQATQIVGARQTGSRLFPAASEGEAIHVTVAASGTTPAFITTVGLLDGTGLIEDIGVPC